MATGASGGLYPPATGAGTVCVPKTSYGGTEVSEASEGLSTSSRSGMVCHSPFAWCGLMEASVYLPQTRCACGVLVCSLANYKLDQTVNRGPGLGKGYQAGRGSVLVSGGAY